MTRPIQYFTKEYLERCKSLSTDEIIEFVENYRNLVGSTPEKCQQICLKIEPSLLSAFKFQAALEGVAYQTKIKELMRAWLLKEQGLRKKGKRH